MNLGGFQAFRRADGRPGARNNVAIVSVMDNCNPATRSIAEHVAGCIAVTTLFVRGQFGDDLAFTYRVLASLGANPDVHSVVLVGLEEASTDKIAAVLRQWGKRVARVTLQPHGTTACIAEGVRLARELVLEASEGERENAPVAALAVGIVSSCVTLAGARALHAQIGRTVDALVDAGATVMISQAAHLSGAQDAFTGRAAQPEVGGDMRATFGRMQELLADAGAGGEAGPTSRQRSGGFPDACTLAVAQLPLFGTQPVRSVLSYGQPADRPGLHWMPTPRGVSETLTSFAAAGCQVLVHALDQGPVLGCAVAPTLCIGLDREDPALDATDPIEDLPALILDVASGSATRSELLRLGQTVISRFARSG